MSADLFAVCSSFVSVEMGSDLPWHELRLSALYGLVGVAADER